MAGHDLTPGGSGGTAAPAGEVRVLPATAERFQDLAVILGQRDPDGDACWCLTYRLPSAQNRALRGRARAEGVQGLCAGPLPPGVLAYLHQEGARWAGVAPRADLHTFASSRRIPHVDDLPVWTV